MEFNVQFFSYGFSVALASALLGLLIGAPLRVLFNIFS